MENNLCKYATAIYQNVMVGVQSIRDIEDKTEDKKLKKELCKKNNLSLEYIIYNENVEKRLDEIIKKYQYKTR